MKKGYLLGDGLKKGNQMLRKLEKEQIAALGTVELFSPWEQKDINDKRNNPTAEMIFAKDTEAILKSEIIVADADNDSVGSTTEIGMIWGLNHLLNKLEEAKEQTTNEIDFADAVSDIMREIPKKKLYWHNSDIRNVETTESGLRRSFSLNQFLYGCLLDVSGEEKTFEDILKELSE